MILTADVIKYVDKSVLCWLATVSNQGLPSVSPKEIFTVYQEEYILIANIASPNSLKNLQENPKLCVSFLDIFVQKGYQLYGTATIVEKGDIEFDLLAVDLLKMTQGLYPFNSIFKILAERVKPIVAPRYWTYPDTTEEEQILSAYKTYGIHKE